MATEAVGSAEMGRILERAEARLWADFEDSGAFRNTGNIGTGREQAIISFLNSRLPSRFKAAGGEIVDIGGTRSGQIDVIVYDALETAPLLRERDGRVLIGTEAVLAVIEVKSTLTRDELRRTLTGVRKIRELRPWGQPWARYRPRGQQADPGPRCFSTLLAFDTNAATTGWGLLEMTRVREECARADLSPEHLDRVAVLTRGVLLPADGRAVSNAGDQRVLGIWYSAFLHFLTREAERRQAFPWTSYESWEGRQWEDVVDPLFTAPEPKKFSATQIGRYRTGR